MFWFSKAVVVIKMKPNITSKKIITDSCIIRYKQFNVNFKCFVNLTKKIKKYYILLVEKHHLDII